MSRSTVSLLTKRYASGMGYTVQLCEQPRGGYVVFSGGRPITKRDGQVMVYRGLQTAANRYEQVVESVEGFEAKLILAGKWHPVRLCAGGCGLEMRITPQTYPDGTVVSVEQQLNEQVRCVECGPFPTEGEQS